jgi:hypothetical protein
VGRWHGYVENEAAPWDELFLDIKGANSNGVCGTLTVSNNEPPASPSNANEVYPAGAWFIRSGPDSVDVGPPLIAGYPSTLLNGKLDGSRIRFGISPREGHRSWCQLQSSYAALGSGGAPSRACSCLPLGATTLTISPRDGGDCSSVTYDRRGVSVTLGCYQAGQCGEGVCACNASGCDAADGLVDNFDLTADGTDRIEGSDTDHPGKRIHFKRAP